MTDWNVRRPDRRCAATGREFEEGEVYYSALIERKQGFERVDFSAEAWADEPQERYFSFWRTRRPEAGEPPRRRMVDVEVVHQFFNRLAGDDRPERLTLRYLLALILMRKRVLRLDATEHEGEAEVLRAYDRRAERLVRVRNPHAGPDELAAAREELACIFDMPLPEDEEHLAAPEPAEPHDASHSRRDS